MKKPYAQEKALRAYDRVSLANLRFVAQDLVFNVSLIFANSIPSSPCVPFSLSPADLLTHGALLSSKFDHNWQPGALVPRFHRWEQLGANGE
jgi:hypothetical protein